MMNKKIIYEMDSLYRESFRITGYEFGQGKKSICIVGNSRGNEVQQIYCCSKLIKKLKQLEEEKRICEGHKILVIPSINPYSMNVQKRFWPTDNTDINRMFPGYNLGETTQRIADAVFKEISTYDYGIQFTSFYNPGEFIPHIRMMDEGYSTVDLAKQFGLPYVIVRKVRPYDTTTLNYNWQVWDTQAFSLYTTVTDRIDPNSAGQALLAVMNFMASQKIISYHGPAIVNSKVVKDTELVSVQTNESGIFEPCVKAGEKVSIGQPLANILCPYESIVKETLYAPIEGKIFFIHNHPLTYANTSVIKIVNQ